MSVVIASALENSFRDGTWSGTAPATTYTLSEFALRQPSARVLWAGTTATVTVTLPASRRVDVLAIPATNATGITVTNNTGLSEGLAVPTLPANRRPRTLVSDLTVLEPNAATRTGSIWHVSFTAADPLIVGAAILGFSPLTALTGDFTFGGDYGGEGYGVKHVNDYGSVYSASHETYARDRRLTKRVTVAADLEALVAWHENSDGEYGLALLWPDTDTNDALVGYLDALRSTPIAPIHGGADLVWDVSITFREVSKGKPV
jgi:hypothetical protein